MNTLKTTERLAIELIAALLLLASSLAIHHWAWTLPAPSAGTPVACKHQTTNLANAHKP